MRAKHTPAPWEYYFGDSYLMSKTHIVWRPTSKSKIGDAVPITIGLIVSEGGRPICELEALGREKEAIAIAEANCRIIRIAPDMWATLKAIDETAKDANPNNPNGDVIIKSEIWDLIQQTLAKEKGKP